LAFSSYRCVAFFALTAVCTLLPATDSGSLAKRGGLSPIVRHAAPAADSQPKLPAGLNLVDWKQIRAEYERHRHGMFPDGQGGVQSRSHYHGWLARFDGKGFTVKPDTQAWSWGLELERWGPQGEEVIAGGAVRILKGVNRLEYRRPGITEWFVNGKEGLGHSFTIKHRPGGGEGELSLQLRQRGELVAEQEPVADQEGAGRSVLYKTKQGAPALRYRKLLVADGEWLRILVDDRRAVYPIVVDPTTQPAYLKASNTMDDLCRLAVGPGASYNFESIAAFESRVDPFRSSASVRSGGGEQRGAFDVDAAATVTVDTTAMRTAKGQDNRGAAQVATVTRGSQRWSSIADAIEEVIGNAP
jgi:hypothetical protein